MADDKDSSDFAVGTWRLVLFFLFILVIDTLWELTDERVTRSLIHCGRKGLIHAWEKIKFEIMALGLVSLILLVVEVRSSARSLSLCSTEGYYIGNLSLLACFLFLMIARAFVRR